MPNNGKVVLNNGEIVPENDKIVLNNGEINVDNGEINVDIGKINVENDKINIKNDKMNVESGKVVIKNAKCLSFIHFYIGNNLNFIAHNCIGCAAANTKVGAFYSTADFKPGNRFFIHRVCAGSV